MIAGDGLDPGTPPAVGGGVGKKFGRDPRRVEAAEDLAQGREGVPQEERLPRCGELGRGGVAGFETDAEVGVAVELGGRERVIEKRGDRGFANLLGAGRNLTSDSPFVGRDLARPGLGTACSSRPTMKVQN